MLTRIERNEINRKNCSYVWIWTQAAGGACVWSVEYGAKDTRTAVRKIKKCRYSFIHLYGLHLVYTNVKHQYTNSAFRKFVLIQNNQIANNTSRVCFYRNIRALVHILSQKVC